jgi:hypothetical protein
MVHVAVSVHQRVAITARVDQKVAEQLKAIARDQDRSLAAELRRAITEHVQARGPKGEAA